MLKKEEVPNGLLIQATKGDRFSILLHRGCKQETIDLRLSVEVTIIEGYFYARNGRAGSFDNWGLFPKNGAKIRIAPFHTDMETNSGEYGTWMISRRPEAEKVAKSIRLATTNGNGHAVYITRVTGIDKPVQQLARLCFDATFGAKAWENITK